MTQASSSPTKKAADGTPGASEGDPVPRGFRVTQEVLDKVGFTKGCGRCEAIRRNDKEHKGHHTKECRKRVEEQMKEDPELKKKLSEVEAKQNRWLGRRVEAYDTRAKPIPEGHDSESSVNTGMESADKVPVRTEDEEVMPLENGLEQLPVGPTVGPSSQGGEEPLERQKDIKSQIDKFQQNIKRMESSIGDLKRQVKEAQDSKDELSESPQPLKALAKKHFHPDGKYDLAELFSPPRMTVMTDKFGLK